MLDRRGFQPGAYLGQQGGTRLASGTVDPHLDQFVRPEAAVHLGQHGFAEPVLADAGDRVQRVGAGAQGAKAG